MPAAAGVLVAATSRHSTCVSRTRFAANPYGRTMVEQYCFPRAELPSCDGEQLPNAGNG